MKDETHLFEMTNPSGSCSLMLSHIEAIRFKVFVIHQKVYTFVIQANLFSDRNRGN